MHESCGKCTPCREGTRWMVQILEKIERGEGAMSDLELLDSINGRILGKVLCALGEFAVYPVSSYIRHWRDEFVAHIQQGRCPYEGRSSIEGILAPSEQHHGPAHVEKPLAVVSA
jgi:NADH-quinone oxidoreductase subunit F